MKFVYTGVGPTPLVCYPGTQVADITLAVLPFECISGGVNIGHLISGYLYYMNMFNTPMTNCWIYLEENTGNTIIDSVLTDGTGYFEFTAPNGDYDLIGSSSWQWSELNIVDIVTTYNSLTGVPLSGLRATAADVNEDVNINIQDVVTQFNVLSNPGNPRTIYGWTAPDYVFERPNVIVSGADVNQDIYTLCSGDARADAVPVP
jgi:hypothetical protein